MKRSRSRQLEKKHQQDTKEMIKKRKVEKHYIPFEFEIFNARYMMVTKIQDGTFGRVVRVYDGGESGFKALKIIKSVQHHIDNAKIEYQILSEIHNKNIDHPGNEKVVRAFEAFNHKSNFCIVFEDLGLSLHDCMKRKQFSGFPISGIQQILYDSFEALDYLHESGYTHTDLKPENILLKDKLEKNTNIQNYHVKIIDLGGAVENKENHKTLINTRQYRAPEVILRNTWTNLSDMWCMGCVAMELYTGKQLFNPRGNDFFHLAMIEKISGPIPLEMIQQSKQEIKEYFNDYQLNDSFLKWPDTQGMVEELKIMKMVRSLIPEEHKLFRNLISQLLRTEPLLRLTTKQALKHDFFHMNY